MRSMKKWLAAIVWFTLAMPALSIAATEENITPLPEKDLFRPLLADPKEPRFQIGLLWVDSDVYNTQVGAVGFGKNFGIARWAGRYPAEAWQLNLSAAVLAQFDMHAPSTECGLASGADVARPTALLILLQATYVT